MVSVARLKGRKLSLSLLRLTFVISGNKKINSTDNRSKGILFGSHYLTIYEI